LNQQSIILLQSNFSIYSGNSHQESVFKTGYTVTYKYVGVLEAISCRDVKS